MVNNDYIQFVLDQLDGLGELKSRKMFGGAGVYCDGFIFALIAEDELYFKTDESNAGDYLNSGMERFVPFDGHAMNYHRVPPRLLDDPESLKKWALKSLDVSRRKKK